MHIALLSGTGGWHVRDLQRAAVALGHTAGVVDFRRVYATLPGQGDSLGGFGAVIVRTMPPGSLEQVVFRMDVLHRFQAGGGRVLNPPLALETCIDKYLASVRLDAAGLPVPPTVVCQDAEAAVDAFHRLGGDVVVKPLFGSEGRGMVRVADEEIAWRTFRTLERLQTVLYIQQYVAHPGWDLRAFVIGGQVLAAMRRHARRLAHQCRAGRPHRGGDPECRRGAAHAGRGPRGRCTNRRRRFASTAHRRLLCAGGERRPRLACLGPRDGRRRRHRNHPVPCIR